MQYFVYILQCADESLYCGYTTNLERRVLEHNSSKKGAKYTHFKRPVKLKYFEKYNSLNDALKREYQIKKLTHIKKAELAKQGVCNLN